MKQKSVEQVNCVLRFWLFLNIKVFYPELRKPEVTPLIVIGIILS